MGVIVKMCVCMCVCVCVYHFEWCLAHSKHSINVSYYY